MLFNSYAQLGAEMPEFSQDEIKNEPMLFSCDADTARQNGGPITRAFLDRLHPEFANGIMDSRVHMLMPGWYPCIPGWHHDDVPRSTPTGQPNYIDPEYRSRHCLALVNGDIAPTEFLTGLISVPAPSIATAIYQKWDEYLERHPMGERWSCPDRKLVYFNCDTFHRGVPAVRNGWRWFGRISIDTDRKPTNEIRAQVQVYMSAINAGW